MVTELFISRTLDFALGALKYVLSWHIYEIQHHQRMGIGDITLLEEVFNEESHGDLHFSPSCRPCRRNEASKSKLYTAPAGAMCFIM